MEDARSRIALNVGKEMRVRTSSNAATPKMPLRSKLEENNQAAYMMASCIFGTFNILAAIYAPIQDCDEVFNYWEPTHYLNHGFGLQTWEYSPDYAIRSWLYVVLHAIPGILGAMFFWKRRYEFYSVRIFLALVCAGAETRLFHAIQRAINIRIAIILSIVMVTTPGMFYASVAYLPSSFAMYTSMMGLGAFIDRSGGSKTSQGIIWFGLGATVGWPFAAALILPLLTNELTHLWLTGHVGEVAYRVIDGVVKTLIIVPLQMAVDMIFYHKILFVPWRIVSYNIFGGSSRGPDIFGTEPWDFYIRNLLLNFNLWFLLAMCSGPLLVLQLTPYGGSASGRRVLKSMSLITPFYLWLAIFSAQAHKEERFMYPAYPFLCFNSAFTMHSLLSFLGKPRSFASLIPAKFRLFIAICSVLFMTMLGLLRIFGTVCAYGTPLEIYSPLQNPRYADMEGTVCLGKEWYRFPSSYFLGTKMRAKFVKSAFDGLLPGEFSEATDRFGLLPTWLTPAGMNDQNIEDPGKYIDIGQCTFLVDSYFPASEPSTLEPSHVLDTKQWKPLQCLSFLDVSQTHPLARIFFVPEWDIIPARYRRRWGKYCLLRRKSPTDRDA